MCIWWCTSTSLLSASVCSVKRLVRVIPNTVLSGPMSIKAFPFVTPTLRHRARQRCTFFKRSREQECTEAKPRSIPTVRPPLHCLRTQTVAPAKRMVWVPYWVSADTCDLCLVGWLASWGNTMWYALHWLFRYRDVCCLSVLIKQLCQINAGSESARCLSSPFHFNPRSILGSKSYVMRPWSSMALRSVYEPESTFGCWVSARSVA